MFRGQLSSQWHLLARASDEAMVGKTAAKNADFLPINISEMIKDRHIVTVEDQ